VSAFDQFKEIDGELREARPDLARFGIQPVRSSIRRVDEAMAGFFRRVKARESPGYPRFTSRGRWRSVFYDEPASWSLRRVGEGDTNPALCVQGIGEIELSKSAVRQLRRLLDRGGEARALVLTRVRSGSWRATIGFRGVQAVPLPASRDIGALDRGITVTAALPDGTLLTMPGFLKEARDTIAALQRELESHKKFSPEWKKLNRAIPKVYRKAHHRSENWARHSAKDIVGATGSSPSSISSSPT
jgi:putative transposase